MSALILSALSVPASYGTAWAGPLQLTLDHAPPLDQNGAAEPPPQPQQRVAQPQSNLGGGFIQFLFGGAAREPMIQRPFQPVPEPYARGYQPGQPDEEAQQAALTQLSSNDPATFAPSSQGDMAHPPVDPKYDRQLVDYRSEEKPGTIVIDTPHHFLFLVQDNGKAMRYGIGVGRPGFTWEGVKTISAKKEWPDWRPPPEMIQRRPDLPRYMAGGPENPLGARAMYLGSTVYRIHGSNEPWTIGSNVSSGCIRLRNADVVDLYNRVQVGTKVVVM
ncbi:MAG: L,D-transpeptidase family protein [Xanthobacteraceae bacterium]